MLGGDLLPAPLSFYGERLFEAPSDRQGAFFLSCCDPTKRRANVAQWEILIVWGAKLQSKETKKFTFVDVAH